jgi:hypothetical protein
MSTQRSYSGAQLICFVQVRVRHHFGGDTQVCREVRRQVMYLLYDMIVLTMALRTPGLAGFLLGGPDTSNSRARSDNDLRAKPARIVSRIHTDLIGIEIALMPLYSTQVSR